ncbi:MAG: hypothetical protein GXO54_00510 [Chloroflexi bacterium]|nr:hypothetical protein [Chloroflexota bacterium]
MRRQAFWLLGLLIGGLLLGCQRATPVATSEVLTPSFVAPLVTPTPIPPRPEQTVLAFFRAWDAGEYETLYAMLTPVSQDAWSKEDFIAYMRALLVEGAIERVEVNIRNALVQGDQAQVRYQITLHNAILGPLTRETEMRLRLIDGQWRIQWDEGSIMPELRGGLRLQLAVIPAPRGDIYDAQGNILATDGEGYALGLIPGQINPEREADLLYLLSRITGLSPDQIRKRYEYAQPDWYIAIDEVPATALSERIYNRLISFEGVVVRAYQGRLYPRDGYAAHAVGYVTPLQPDELDTYRRRGYAIGARIGRTGIERWAEDPLRGRNGGILSIVDAQGQTVQTLGRKDPTFPAAVYTTFDPDLQYWTCFAIKDFDGAAAVVLERDTGRILALCSRPWFNPNAFEPNNFNSQNELAYLFNQPNTPLLNRVTQGQYPPGSIFKLVTMAAALENHVVDLDYIYNCGYEFNEIEGLTLTDWTLKYDLPPSGPLNIVGGLARSCNPFFWHLGLSMFRQGLIQAVADMARGFGLGQPTGVPQYAEEEGYIPVPASEYDAVNNAIGQGKTLVTPLQIARMVAAIGNGGTLYRPNAVERVVNADGSEAYGFQPEAMGQLPISETTLRALWEGMYRVVHHPMGTASHVFINWPIPTYGKTGTAEVPEGEPHAWFVAFTDAQQEDRPDVALAIVLEHGGSGGNVAAPVARRILESHFFGQPRTVYPWEESIGKPARPANPPEEETPEADTEG